MSTEPRLVAIDTATRRAAVAIGSGRDAALASRSWEAGYRHGEELLAVFDELLRHAGTALGDLASAGFEVGSHGSRHGELDALPVEQARDDVNRSRDRIGERIGRAPTSFCYPHGYHSAAVRRIVADAGFSNACEVGHGLHSLAGDPLRIRRVMVTADLPPSQLVARLTGPARDASSLTREVLRPAWRTVRRGRRTVTRSWVKA